MRILFVAPRLPHRRVMSGHQIVYQRMRRLMARGHKIGLACFSRPGEESLAAEWAGELLSLETVPEPDVKGFQGFPGARTARLKPHSAELLRRVGDMVERDRYHIAIAEFTEMGPYLCRNPFLPAVRRVISVHQCFTVAAQKQVELKGWTFAGLRARIQRDRLRQSEFALYREADRILALTPQEQFAMQQQAPDLRTALSPAGVDTRFFGPSPGLPMPGGLIFTGYFNHEPNRDAVRWFVSRVWPAVRARYPELFFYVVGPNPPPDILNLSWKDPTIVVTGEVEDVRPYLHQASVFICPIRMGSGMRIKILEAMASELPVVSTSLGAEGLPLQQGVNGFVADHPRIMAEQIQQLLSDAPLRKSMGNRARTTVRAHYSWDQSVRGLERLFQELTERPARPPAESAK
ncbi:MAG: glycosyltransferase [Kiritimatiellae bacterium]|nr:glycosyltransferase [Kiritimatiellia bacterium]